MARKEKVKLPELRLGAPIWWNLNGMKMEKIKFRNGKSLTIENSVAKVTIARKHLMHWGWGIRWSIEHEYKCTTSGNLIFIDQQLASAFGLCNNPVYNDSEELIKRYGAEVAAKGLYIRWKDYLNLPCPGTGFDGDPNLSIYLSHEIRMTVKEMLEEDNNL
jgi:hypothetical protein